MGSIRRVLPVFLTPRRSRHKQAILPVFLKFQHVRGVWFGRAPVMQVGLSWPQVSLACPSPVSSYWERCHHISSDWFRLFDCVNCIVCVNFADVNCLGRFCLALNVMCGLSIWERKWFSASCSLAISSNSG